MLIRKVVILALVITLADRARSATGPPALEPIAEDQPLDDVYPERPKPRSAFMRFLGIKPRPAAEPQPPIPHKASMNRALELALEGSGLAVPPSTSSPEKVAPQVETRVKEGSWWPKWRWLQFRKPEPKPIVPPFRPAYIPDLGWTDEAKDRLQYQPAPKNLMDRGRDRVVFDRQSKYLWQDVKQPSAYQRAEERPIGAEATSQAAASDTADPAGTTKPSDALREDGGSPRSEKGRMTLQRLMQLENAQSTPGLSTSEASERALPLTRHWTSDARTSALMDTNSRRLMNVNLNQAARAGGISTSGPINMYLKMVRMRAQSAGDTRPTIGGFSYPNRRTDPLSEAAIQQATTTTTAPLGWKQRLQGSLTTAWQKARTRFQTSPGPVFAGAAAQRNPSWGSQFLTNARQSFASASSNALARVTGLAPSKPSETPTLGDGVRAFIGRVRQPFHLL